MLLRRSGRLFMDLAWHPAEIGAQLTRRFFDQTGHRVSASEVRSWSGSLPALATDLDDAGLGNVEVLLEYQLPLTSRRADVVLAGRHPRTGNPSFVVVELKQWSQVELWPDSPELVLVPGAPGGPRLHPVAQVRRYRDYLTDFLRIAHDRPDAFVGAAYLHNAGVDVETGLGAYPQDNQARLFTGAGRSQFVSTCSPGSTRMCRADRLPTSSFGPVSRRPVSC